MFLVRDVMHCKPGQVRPMVQKFLALSKVMKDKGFGSVRVMTDVSGERYWTVVAEIEAADIGEFTRQARQASEAPEMKTIMQGYHDLVEGGRREIFNIDG